MGPTFFFSLRKVHIFGVCLEGCPVQYNYLFDESQCMTQDGAQSHGANAVILMLDDCLTKYGYGEPKAEFHADNYADNLILMFAVKSKDLSCLNHSSVYPNKIKSIKCDIFHEVSLLVY